MGKITFSKAQQKKLLTHKYVQKCGRKQINYTAEFKALAVKQYNQGKAPFQIFEEAGFDPKTFDIDYVRYRLKNWRAVVASRGWEALHTDTRGRLHRKKSVVHLSDKQKVHALELKVKYLEAEKDFLVKLRAKKDLQ